MKKFIFLSLVFSVLFAVQMNAQNTLTGPAAKNCKSYKKADASAVVAVKQHKPHTGPKAKNRTVLNDNCATTHLVSKKRIALTGPKAKNGFAERNSVQAVVKNQ